MPRPPSPTFRRPLWPRWFAPGGAPGRAAPPQGPRQPIRRGVGAPHRLLLVAKRRDRPPRADPLSLVAPTAHVEVDDHRRLKEEPPGAGLGQLRRRGPAAQN